MKKLQELTLFDKFLFDETMDIPEAHEAVLQIIFGDDNLKLLTPAQTEKEIRTVPWLRSIRLDVYAIDQEKRIYYNSVLTSLNLVHLTLLSLNGHILVNYAYAAITR